MTENALYMYLQLSVVSDCSSGTFPGDAINSFIHYYIVMPDNGSKFVPQNSPMLQFETTLTQSLAQPSLFTSLQMIVVH